MIDTVLYVVATICFFLAAIGVAVPKVHLGWLGAALLGLSLLI